MPGTGNQIGRSLFAWIRASVINGFVVALLFSVGFALSGVSWWLAFGLVAGLANAVPVLGSLCALALSLYAGLFTHHEGWTGLLFTGGVWLVVQIVEGFLLSPRAAGHAGVPPLLSIPLVLIAGLVFGPLGAILAVPVAAVLLIVHRTGRRHRRL